VAGLRGCSKMIDPNAIGNMLPYSGNLEVYGLKEAECPNLNELLIINKF
jgi:hypothetical protein